MKKIQLAEYVMGVSLLGMMALAVIATYQKAGALWGTFMLLLCSYVIGLAGVVCTKK